MVLKEFTDQNDFTEGQEQVFEKITSRLDTYERKLHDNRLSFDQNEAASKVYQLSKESRQVLPKFGDELHKLSTKISKAKSDRSAAKEIKLFNKKLKKMDISRKRGNEYFLKLR